MNIVLTVKAPVNNILGALYLEDVRVHSIREDGTMRRRHFLVPASKDREIAEWVRLQREGQEADEDEGIEAVTPRGMKAIAREMHISIAAVRRILTDLAITEELEDSDEDELSALLMGAEEEDAVTEPISE